MEFAEQENEPPGIEEQQLPLRRPNGGANVSSEGGDGSEGEDPRLVQIGGEIATPAFALLDGVVYDNHSDGAQFKSVTIPITRLPATLGRTHDTKDPNFFGMGPKKVVSREQCRIFYRSAFGGTLGQKGSSDELAYLGPRTNPKGRVSENKAEDKLLPCKGHFAIECLGKNKIVVGKQRVEHGEVAPLQSGMPIKIGSYCLYFLLPADAPEEVMSIPNPAYKKMKKRPFTTDPGSLPNKKFQPGGALQRQLESMSVEGLIAEIITLEPDQLGHRHKLIRGIVTVHGVRDALRSKSIRKIAKEKGGVSKAAIMDWLAENDLYSNYVKHTLSTMEVASYQTNITKALVKAGCVRIGSTGRFVTWKLPESVLSDGKEEKHGDVDGPGKASDSDYNDQGVQKKDVDEDSDKNERNLEDEKESEAENQGVGKIDLDDDSDDDERDDEEKESHEKQGVGEEDVDENSHDNESEEEAKKESPSDGINEASKNSAGEEDDEEDEKESLNKDQFDDAGGGDDDDNDDLSDDGSLSPARSHDKEMDLEGNKEDSDNDEMEVMDDYSYSSNNEIPQANSNEAESSDSGKPRDSDLPVSGGDGKKSIDVDAFVNLSATKSGTGDIDCEMGDMEI